MLSPNIATEIIEDLQQVATLKSEPPDACERVAAAAYELSLCHIQGFGCDVSYDRAARLLIQSAELGSRRAQNSLLRIFGALEMPIPCPIERHLLEWTTENAIAGSPSAIEELHELNPTLLTSTKHKMRTLYSPMGRDIFRRPHPKRL